jgi:hypothetical protein
MNAKNEIYMDTKEVVNRLFCLLKLNICSIGSIKMIILVIILTQRVFPQSSDDEKYTYPSTF